ncbi:MAG: Ltp family lipoprotein [Anaerolineaceae bacterium]|nr:Ltp family lipoprotein [Anaerolineaceae bacterium]
MRNKTRSFHVLIVLFFMICLFLSGRAVANQADALKAALSYLSSTAYSRNALIKKLESDGFSRADAEYAVANIYVDWYQMAADVAASYLASADYSYKGLIRKLESSTDGFTHEEAVYGADTAGKDVDWSEMAARRASFYLKSSAFSENGLIHQLESEMVGFTHDEALKGVEIAGADIDWNEQAVKRCESLLDTGAYSETGLIAQLESPAIGFTHEQAVYAVSVVGEGVDWDQIAVKKAESYLQVMSVTRQELIDYLESPSEGFTHDQALFAVDNCGASWSDMIEVLSENLDNLFPIRGLEDKFTTPMQALYSDNGPGTAVETRNQDGVRTLTMFANSDGIHDSNLITRINSGQLQNFMFSMDITVNDAFPGGSAGCYVGYINDLAAATHKEESTVVLLMADAKGVGFYRKTKSQDAGTFTRVWDGVSDTYRLSIVRFTGQTYAYVDGVYAGQLQDTNAGPFQLIYGVSVLAGGDDASCSFDNLSVKKVNN